MGIARENLIPLFYNSDKITFENGSFYRPVDASLIGTRIEKGMIPEKFEQEFVGLRVTKDTIAALNKAKIKTLTLAPANLLNKVLAKDLVDHETGEIIVEQGQLLTEQHLELIQKFKKLDFDIIASSGYVFQPTLATTLLQDHCNTRDEAIKELHAKVWPGDNASIKEVQESGRPRQWPKPLSKRARAWCLHPLRRAGFCCSSRLASGRKR